MADSYSKIHIQIVLPVRSRESFIQPEWEDELYKYITGAVQGEGNKMLAINGVKDHIHFLFRMKPTYLISDGIRELKKSSNNYIRNTIKVCPKFTWQPGFGAFSYGEWDLDRVIKYIQNQKEHHKKNTFKKEYIQFLEEFKIEYKEDYLFEWYDAEK
jgi:REP element-mobilizing transposase RayT